MAQICETTNGTTHITENNIPCHALARKLPPMIFSPIAQTTVITEWKIRHSLALAQEASTQSCRELAVIVTRYRRK